jgi:DNA-binding transcriptional LysR family regulator
MDRADLAGIDLNLLVVLDVLLAERSVTRAAARLGLSQPATSNALARLRGTFGDPLLVRTTGGMAPTPRAVALQEPLRHALDGVGSAIAGEQAFDPATARRTFVLAATDYVQFVLLGPLVERMQAEAPGVVLRLVPMTHGSPWLELEAGSVDLTLSGAPTHQARIRRRALFHDRVVCILRADHPAARRSWNLARYLALGHVEALPLGGRGLVDDVLESVGQARRLAVTVPHFLVAPHVVLRSDHCFALAERIARPMAAVLPLKVLPVPIEIPAITIWAYWHERMQRDPAHQWLRRLLADVANEVGPTAAAASPARPTRRKRGK